MWKILIREQNAAGFVAAIGVISRFTFMHSVGDRVGDHHGAEFCTPVSELHHSYTHTFDFAAFLPEHNFFTRLSFTYGRNH